MEHTRITRRTMGHAAGAALAALALPALSPAAFAQVPMRTPYVADMHSHYGMYLPRLFGMDLDRHMRENGIVLLSWAVVDDRPWMSSTAGGNRQVAIPRPGQIWAAFQATMAAYKERLAKWNVQLALNPADVDTAMGGNPRVLLACESANFLEGDPARLTDAHALGVRHLQLVHCIASPLGDHQTAEPLHGRLTPAGASVVAECRRLGMVVDLAHGTASMVDGALEASDAAMVWSHSWISAAGGTHRDPGYVARSLALPVARKIAARGGAIGLWCLRLPSDPAYAVNSKASYADEIMRRCDLVGPEHVAFGTDMEGVWPGRVMNDYSDLRDVIDNLGKRGIADATLRSIFIGNYTRIVKQAMASGAALTEKS